MAAYLRSELKIDVELVEGNYGEFSVLVDGEKIIGAGPLAVVGVVPSKQSVREIVARRLGISA